MSIGLGRGNIFGFLLKRGKDTPSELIGRLGGHKKRGKIRCFGPSATHFTAKYSSPIKQPKVSPFKGLINQSAIPKQRTSRQSLGTSRIHHQNTKDWLLFDTLD